MPDSSTTSATPPDDRRDPRGDETIPVPVRKDTLAATSGADFRHGRFEPGQRLGSRYRIVARLGAGGMGEVYRADDLELGQSVALKFLPERVAADESWLRRFRNEVRTARQIAHPNICRIYDIGEAEGHVFLSMEYVDGEDLSGVLRRLGRPSREKAIEIARQICLGLASAHDAHVLHRDLKPANIMIDGRGRVRITDFGLAGFLDDLEGVEARAGTPAYMAPEQLVSGTVSVRSDIYTLGLILHELFTGKCVFDTNDLEELKRKHTSGSVSTPSSITEDIDPAVERVIMRCLEEDPARRPQSVYQVLAALPGGDPLAAALAAGETPSPELVANARDAGGLTPGVAIALLLVCLASAAVAYVVSTATVVMPARSPARLSVVAEQILERVGFEELPPRSVAAYDTNMALDRSLASAPETLEQLRESTWPPRYRYWRRWSTGGFLPSDPHFPEQFAIDSPTHSPAETAVVALDSRGRLIELAIAPALADRAKPMAADQVVSSLFEFAGLDRSAAVEAPPKAAPPVYCDTVTAWQVRIPEVQDPVLVQVGTLDGRPNYFECADLRGAIEPDHGQLRSDPRLTEYCWLAFEVLIVILAVRNLYARRADHRNALRCGAFVGGLYLLLEIIAISVGGLSPREHVVDLANGRAAGHFLIHAAEGWVYYLAIEPYVRRIWPRMLIGLVRVMSGRWRDPAVGREILIGLATGSALAVTAILVPFVEALLAGRSPAHLVLPTPLRAVLSSGHHLSDMAHLLAWAVLSGISGAGVVVLIRLLVRNHIASLCVGAVVLGGLNYDLYSWTVSENMTGKVVCAIGLGVCNVWLLSRVGVLSTILFYFVMFALPLFGLAFGGWVTPYLVAWLATFAALVTFGFWLALAGRPIFRDMLSEPRPAVS